jgi:abortive infection bacteriophage resistance protein
VLRNYVAHHGRIWNRRFTYPPKASSSFLPKELEHLRRVGDGINLLYPRLAVLRWLERDDLHGFSFDEELRKVLSSLPVHERINLGSMGFPTDWHDTELWQLKN